VTLRYQLTQVPLEIAVKMERESYNENPLCVNMERYLQNSFQAALTLITAELHPLLASSSIYLPSLTALHYQ